MCTFLLVSLVLAIAFYFYLFRYDAKKGLAWEAIFGGPFIWVLMVIILTALGIKTLVKKVRGY